MDAYADSDIACVESWSRVHGNGEQTHVSILRLDADRYVAVATDVDPVEFQPGDSETIAFDPTEQGARERARRWCEQNPKGIGGGSGGGTLSKVVGGLKKLDQSGQQQVHGDQE